MCRYLAHIALSRRWSSTAIRETRRARNQGVTYLVTERTDHPNYPGGEIVYCYIAEHDKRLWAMDERCVDVIEPERARTDAW